VHEAITSMDFARELNGHAYLFLRRRVGQI
jgi:hypothetical protein